MSLRDAAELARLRELVERQGQEIAELRAAVAAMKAEKPRKNAQAV